jgi:hypothetical protein
MNRDGVLVELSCVQCGEMLWCTKSAGLVLCKECVGVAEEQALLFDEHLEYIEERLARLERGT